MWRPAPEGVRPARRAECSRTLWPYRHVSRGAAGFNLPFAAPGSRRLISGAAETAALPSHGRRAKPASTVAASEVDAAHGLGGVARAGGGARRRHFVNARQVLRREHDFRRPEILVQISASLGADEGNNLFAARQQPGKRELRGRAVFLPGDLLDAPDKLEIALEIFSLEARRIAAVVAGRKIFEALDAPRQEAAAQRRIGDKTDAQLAAHRQDFVFGVAGPQRIFGLKRRDRMNGRGATQGCGRGFGKPQRAHLALLDQLCHGSDRIFHRSVWVDAMLVVKINALYAQPLEACLATLAHVLRAAVDTHPTAVGAADVAELCGKDHLPASTADCAADQFLVFAHAVDVGGVEKIDSPVESAVDRGNGLIVVAPGVEFGHPHTAQAEG